MPDNQVDPSGKVTFLDGLRGVAAMQVVLLHFVTGFLPKTAEHAWPPLRLLFDGHTAVYTFFLISGAVLTPSFARPGSFVVKIGRRIVRLGIPAAAAAAIATMLLATWPDAHRDAARLTSSAWLAMDSSGAPTLAHLAREIGLDSLLLGFRESTLFTPIARYLTPMENALDAPLWSLHLELYGSLLVLALVSLRARARCFHPIGIALAAFSFGTHPMFLFVLGHLAATLPRRRPDIALSVLGAISLGLGLALCATKNWGWVEAARMGLSRHELASAPDLFQFQSQLGAVALYFGVVLTPAARVVLSRRPFRALGRLSFSIYLLHFPILFTLVAASFSGFLGFLPYAGAVAASFVLLVIVTLLAALPFERHVDQFAIALSRWSGRRRWRTA